jgi:hypothetical protein
MNFCCIYVCCVCDGHVKGQSSAVLRASLLVAGVGDKLSYQSIRAITEQYVYSLNTSVYIPFLLFIICFFYTFNKFLVELKVYSCGQNKPTKHFIISLKVPIKPYLEAPSQIYLRKLQYRGNYASSHKPSISVNIKNNLHNILCHNY